MTQASASTTCGPPATSESAEAISGYHYVQSVPFFVRSSDALPPPNIAMQR
jgi:hypothetical protein